MSFLVTLLLTVWISSVESCNEAVCGPIVSKCLLTQSCKCNYKVDCSCCKECARCLSNLYEECCSCVDICPQRNESDIALSKQSQIEEFPRAYSDLFAVLTSSPDQENRWKSFTYSLDISDRLLSRNDVKYQIQSVESDVVMKKPNSTSSIDCTVAFWSECKSYEKCKEGCMTMGSSKMRWFHNGCCECISEYCIDYGINESKCSRCSDEPNEEDDSFDDNVLDNDYELD